MPTKSKTRKPRATVADNETPEARFVRLANKRVAKTLNDLKLVGNLARYAHSPEQAAKIVEALSDAMDDTARKFSAPAAKAKPSFQL